MKQLPFKNVLRNAVIAAIPLTTQIGCGATGTTEMGGVSTTTPQPGGTTGPVSHSNDPCRTGETTRKSAQESYSSQLALLQGSMTAEQCIALCKQTFEQRRVNNMFSDLVKLERIEASNCKIENRPYSDIVPAGQIPNKPSTLISCDVSYTALHSPYTCPRPVVGRVPNGMHLDAGHTADVAAPNSVGEYLADMAAMETAAIRAFDYLSRELEAYGAPAELTVRAREAMVEETRHAEMAWLLSAAYGADVPEVIVDEFTLRSLYEIALENAVEGCVNETFAAACGLWQSEYAGLDVFRRVIAHISDEEMGHAALSWEIHQWIMPQLSPAEQEKILVAQAEAVEKLLVDFQQEGNLVLQQAFGLPTRAEAARLFVQLKGSVWKAVGSLGFDSDDGKLLV